MRMSRDEYTALITRKPHLAPDTPPLRTPDPQPAKRRSLVNRVSRKEARGPRFEIVFTVYAVQPADWDGYSIKALQDMLVESGIIPGDSWDTLQGRVISTKAEGEDMERTEVTITEQEAIQQLEEVSK